MYLCVCILIFIERSVTMVGLGLYVSPRNEGATIHHVENIPNDSGEGWKREGKVESGKESKDGMEEERRAYATWHMVRAHARGNQRAESRDQS
jgi:hypothetical protein